MMAKAPPALVRRACESAREYVDRMVLVVAPGDPLERLELPIAGSVRTEPWVNYGHNRSRTLMWAEEQAARWILMLDADDELAPGGRLPPLEGPEAPDAYRLIVHFGGDALRFYRPHLFRARVGWKFEGVTHEAAVGPPGARLVDWDGLAYLQESASSRPLKFYEDARRLAEVLAKDPTNARAAFYYAQSLKDSGNPVAALGAYLNRARMGGFADEVFLSLLWAGRLSERVGLGFEYASTLYQRALAVAPCRAEPLLELARGYRWLGELELATSYKMRARGLAHPRGPLFVESGAYVHTSRGGNVA